MPPEPARCATVPGDVTVRRIPAHHRRPGHHRDFGRVRWRGSGAVAHHHRGTGHHAGGRRCAGIATEPRLAGIQPLDTGLIGQSSWYTVEPASGVGAFIVSIRIGWGDCPAGCINEHTWTYAIGPRGEVTILSESGEPVPPDAWPSPLGAG